MLVAFLLYFSRSFCSTTYMYERIRLIAWMVHYELCSFLNVVSMLVYMYAFNIFISNIFFLIFTYLYNLYFMIYEVRKFKCYLYILFAYNWIKSNPVCASKHTYIHKRNELVSSLKALQFDNVLQALRQFLSLKIEISIEPQGIEYQFIRFSLRKQ